jgi:nucleotide-binding universal stress UspA family protein
VNGTGGISGAPTTVGWDGSSSSRTALLWAIDRERQWPVSGRGGLLVVAVVNAAFRSRGAAAMDQLALAARKALDAEVDWIAFNAPEIVLDVRVAVGDPVTVLQDQCPPESLIVVGHRFHAQGSGRGLAARLAASAPQPVVVVTSSPDPALDQIVVGFDGTPASVRASVAAAVEADRRGARLNVVHAWPGAGSVLLADVTEIETRRSRHERIVAAAVDAIRSDHPSLAVQGHLEIGSALDVLRRRAAGAALLVVGSRGQGPVRRFVLGSVSTALLDSAGCPVMVVTAPRAH